MDALNWLVLSYRLHALIILISIIIKVLKINQRKKNIHHLEI